MKPRAGTGVTRRKRSQTLARGDRKSGDGRIEERSVQGAVRRGRQLPEDAILHLRRQNDFLTDLGQNGRRQLESKFSRVSCVDMHENMLSTLVQE